MDITKATFGEQIKKSPDFAKEVVITFMDDVSVATMRALNEGKEEWMEKMVKEVIKDWNLENEKGEKLPICMASLDKINSIKLRNWVIATMQEVVTDSLEVSKKKPLEV